MAVISETGFVAGSCEIGTEFGGSEMGSVAGSSEMLLKLLVPRWVL